ncbi:hypothetical protein BX666DRAFT_1919590 [Dichotomocladium elegans]|nr:hypothetical protein BX666DRAFT_1919590 [Dichotomocladium elegans]
MSFFNATIALFRPSLPAARLISVRSASVLASVPPTPLAEASAGPTSSTSSLPNQDHIVTPAYAPLTTPSNNAFHPDYIPKPVKARLTLDELKQVLNTSKALLNHLQSEYLDHQSLQNTLAQMAKDQEELLKTLARHRQHLFEDDSNDDGKDRKQ